MADKKVKILAVYRGEAPAFNVYRPEVAQLACQRRSNRHCHQPRYRRCSSRPILAICLPQICHRHISRPQSRLSKFSVWPTRNTIGTSRIDGSGESDRSTDAATPITTSARLWMLVLNVASILQWIWPAAFHPPVAILASALLYCRKVYSHAPLRLSHCL